jgi:hypothetical protein
MLASRFPVRQCADMNDEDSDYRRAQGMLERVQKAAFKIDGSQLDRNLSRKLTPPELAGAYIFRSIDVLIKAGLSMEEIKLRQQEMMRLAIDIRSEQCRKADDVLQ